MAHITQVHKHRRERQNKNLQPYPHPEKKYQVVDRIVDVISIIFPFTILPQIYEIWVKKNTAGVSVLTWSLFLFFTIILSYYAYIHKEKKLGIMYALFCIAYVVVLLGIFIVG